MAGSALLLVPCGVAGQLVKSGGGSASGTAPCSTRRRRLRLRKPCPARPARPMPRPAQPRPGQPAPARRGSPPLRRAGSAAARARSRGRGAGWRTTCQTSRGQTCSCGTTLGRGGRGRAGAALEAGCPAPGAACERIGAHGGCSAGVAARARAQMRHSAAGQGALTAGWRRRTPLCPPAARSRRGRAGWLGPAPRGATGTGGEQSDGGGLRVGLRGVSRFTLVVACLPAGRLHRRVVPPPAPAACSAAFRQTEPKFASQSHA